MRLMRPLDYVYAIRFKIDYAKLEDLLIFQIAILNAEGKERSFYQWTLSKTQGKLIVKPLEYQAENSRKTRPDSIGSKCFRHQRFSGYMWMMN